MCSKQEGRRSRTSRRIALYVDHVTVPSILATPQRLQVYKLAQIEDSECSRIREYCKTQWPGQHSMESLLKANWKVRGSLTLCNDLLLYNSRIVVLSSLRRETMLKIHEGHQGVERCRSRLRTSVWWPGAASQVQ